MLPTIVTDNTFECESLIEYAATEKFITSTEKKQILENVTGNIVETGNSKIIFVNFDYLPRYETNFKFDYRFFVSSEVNFNPPQDHQPCGVLLTTATKFTYSSTKEFIGKIKEFSPSKSQKYKGSIKCKFLMHISNQISTINTSWFWFMFFSTCKAPRYPILTEDQEPVDADMRITTYGTLSETKSSNSKGFCKKILDVLLAILVVFLVCPMFAGFFACFCVFSCFGFVRNFHASSFVFIIKYGFLPLINCLNTSESLFSLNEL